MEAACLRHTELPGTSRLFGDFQYHFDRVARFYAHDPHDPASYQRAACELDYPDDRRAALVAALRRANPDSKNLERLARPGTVAVVTGQQVGLYSGPAYTIYKALTAARMAEWLRGQGIEAVPLFWLATEDHDLAEVNHGWVFDRAYRPNKLSISPEARGQQPVGQVPLNGTPHGELREALLGMPYADEVEQAAARSYVSGKPLGRAFQDLLQELLAPYDLIFVDPLDPALRSIAAPLLARAFDLAGQLTPRLLERGAELAGAGYHAQVHVEAGTSLFFVLDQGQRVPLRKGTHDTVSLKANAELLSPNALLRPVVQDYLLPTVAYIGGPAELAYLAQSSVLYQELLGRMPVAAARGSFTLVDAKSRRRLQRFRLPVTEYFDAEAVVKEKIGAKLVPPALDQTVREAQESAERLLAKLRSQVLHFDPTLAKAASKSADKVSHQFRKLGAKIGRESLRRESQAAESATQLLGLLYPEKHLQERIYSILPFLAEHGPGLIGTLYENIHLDCPDHKLLYL